MGLFVPIIVAFSTSEFLAVVSNTVRILMPALMFLPFFIWYGHSLEWPEGLWWLSFVTVLIGAVAVSAMTCAFDNIRSLAHGMSMYVPLAYLAFRPPDLDRFSRVYFQAAALLGSLWIWGHFMTTTRELGPYSLGIEESLAMEELNMLWPLLLGMGKYSSGRQRLWYWGLAAFDMGAVFLLFSRTMFVAMIFILLILLIYENKYIGLGIVLLVVLIVALAPSDVLRDYLTWYRYVDFEAESSRSLIRRIAIDTVESNMLLGIGAGNAPYVLFGMNAYYGAHNNILTVALEIGIFGAFLVAAFEAYALYTGGRLALRGGIGPYYAGSIAALFAGSLTDDWVHRPGQTLLLVIILMNARLLLKTRHEKTLSFKEQKAFADFPKLRYVSREIN